jgi:tyrosyl-tRNA synthetase
MTNGPVSIDGITLPLVMRSEVAKLAKNDEIQLQYFREDKGTYEMYGFSQYLEVKLAEPYFNSLPREKKINKIKQIERRFYQAAFQQLATEDRYSNVLDAIMERQVVRE